MGPPKKVCRSRLAANDFLYSLISGGDMLQMIVFSTFSMKSRCTKIDYCDSREKTRLKVNSLSIKELIYRSKEQEKVRAALPDSMSNIDGN